MEGMKKDCSFIIGGPHCSFLHRFLEVDDHSFLFVQILLGVSDSEREYPELLKTGPQCMVLLL